MATHKTGQEGFIDVGVLVVWNDGSVTAYSDTKTLDELLQAQYIPTVRKDNRKTK